MKEQSIIVTIKSIRFYNESNSFAIFSADDSKGKTVVAKGVIYNPSIEGTYTLTGKWENNPKWGRQFNFTTALLKTPKTLKGIQAYLSKGNIYGIGPELAKKIVDHFGEELISIIEKGDIGRIKEVPGIGEKKAESAEKSWDEQADLRETIISLQTYGIEAGLAQRLYKKYKEQAISKVLQNPYYLTKEVNGIGFKTADSIAEKLNIQGNNPFRIDAGIRHILENWATQEGNTYIQKTNLIEISYKLLNEKNDLVTKDEIKKQLDVLALNNEIIIDDNRVFLRYYYLMEENVARHLSRLLHNSKNSQTKKCNISAIEKRLNIKYDETQINAIKTALDNNVVVITGGPGSGKTTVVKGIIEALKRKNQSISLAAPTGKAAKRMKETTSLPATTIHRLLELDPISHSFAKNDKDPLENKLIIIDESSMIDVSLFSALIKAVPNDAKLILVGDVDQLPSVGPGKVLKDIIESKIVPVITLNTIHRQAQQSHIITNAYKINNRQMPDIDLPPDSDFTFIQNKDENEIQNIITKLSQIYKEKNIEAQVLSPMRQRGINCTDELNKRLQQALNPNGEEIKYGQKVFRVRDKVIQLKNNYNKMVFNGDMGIIRKIDKKKRKIYIKFDDKAELVEYENNSINQISLAYACTIHKSQGSEFPVVIIPYTKAFYIMLQKKLIYTAVTRAKKKLFVIGDIDAIKISINARNNKERQTMLKEKLQDYYNHYQEYEDKRYYTDTSETDEDNIFLD